jgi:SAM-dependent methyltransferase
MDKRLVADIIQWDVRNWSQALHFWERDVDWNSVSECMELGSRDGGLSLWLALKNKHVICSDVEDNRNRARRHHEKRGVTAGVDYQIIDALEIPYESRFDLVVFKSILGGIGLDGRKDRQQLAIDQIYKSLKPGGKLLFIENLIASPMHNFVRKKFIRWGTSWRYVTLQEMQGFFHRFARVRMKTVGVLGAFGRSERQRNLLALIDQAVLNHLTPDRWQYVVYGIAEKQADMSHT